MRTHVLVRLPVLDLAIRMYCTGTEPVLGYMYVVEVVVRIQSAGTVTIPVLPTCKWYGCTDPE